MNIAKHVRPLEINGLTGRMLVIPSESGRKRNILLLYGHHSSLERMSGIAEDLSQYGEVTMPDFPGFGGMDSFYKIGMEPTIDNIADYLAAFIKLRYKNKKITIGGLSFGFVVATRMLQKYPHMTAQVDMLISIVGFCRYDEFLFSKNRMRLYKLGARVFEKRLPAIFFKNVILHPSLLRLVYSRMHNAKAKFKGLSAAESRAAMDFEVHLWHCNDVRTYMHTTISMLTLDNCRKYVALPVEHVAVGVDQYFNNQIVEQHMRVIFTDYTEHMSTIDKHTPSVIADKQAASVFMPKSIRIKLSQGSKK